MSKPPTSPESKRKAPIVEVRIVICECGCETAYAQAFINKKPVKTLYDVAIGNMSPGREGTSSRKWLAKYDSKRPA